MTLILLALLACDNDAEKGTTPVLGSDDDTGPPGGCGPVHAAFNANRVVCHSGASPQGDLDLTDPNAVVGLGSLQSDLDLVTPLAPDDSYLWHKIEGTHRDAGGNGDAMPPPDLPALPAADQDAVFAWIADGAICLDDTGETGLTDTAAIDDSACQEVQELVAASSACGRTGAPSCTRGPTTARTTGTCRTCTTPWATPPVGCWTTSGRRGRPASRRGRWRSFCRREGHQGLRGVRHQRPTPAGARRVEAHRPAEVLPTDSGHVGGCLTGFGPSWTDLRARSPVVYQRR